MFGSEKEARAYIAKEQVKALDLKYVDLSGRWRHVTLPPSAFGSRLLNEGVGFDGSSVGFKKTHSGDLVAIPDLTTALLDPFWERKTLGFVCQIADADSKEPFPYDPRFVAKRAEQYLSEIGWADRSTWGPELEFNIFDRVSYQNDMNRSNYDIICGEFVCDALGMNSGFHTLPMQGYHRAPPADSSYDLRSEMSAHLETMGIEIKYHHHEVGGAGEVEIEIPMGGLLETADRVMLIKYAAKMVGHRKGKCVTFMPKPIYGDGGNGMHVHQTLWKGNRNLFFDSRGYGGLSATALSYIAGLFDHARSVLAFTNPSTNSYRRLVPGFEAPTNLFFSVGNRSAAIRIPTYATSESEKRIEFRPPDASSNIYFCLVVQLLAGIAGVEDKRDAAGYGPIDEDIHSWPTERVKGIKSLPVSLEDALEGIRLDQDFLLRGKIFSEEMIQTWIDYKTRRELDQIRGRPHPFEFALYYDV
jgi:glutamine synthetase